MVVLFGLVYEANALIGPGNFHVRGGFTVRGIGAVQALFLGPWDGDDVGWRGAAVGVRVDGR